MLLLSFALAVSAFNLRLCAFQRGVALFPAQGSTHRHKCEEDERGQARENTSMPLSACLPAAWIHGERLVPAAYFFCTRSSERR